jgi:phosphatidylethanolamine-binding protein (PEBP) family uncharacterized protein
MYNTIDEHAIEEYKKENHKNKNPNKLNYKNINFNKRPTIKINNMLSGKWYTIMMVDPDALTRETHEYRWWLHWLIINNDETIIPYNGPSPPYGTHRYYIILYEQPNKISLNTTPNRKQFNVGAFIKKLKFVDLTMFRYKK